MAQGSVLGSTLFLINNYEFAGTFENTYSILFVDDITIVGKQLDQMVTKEWCSASKLCLNEQKTKKLLFRQRTLGISNAFAKLLGVML